MADVSESFDRAKLEAQKRYSEDRSAVRDRNLDTGRLPKGISSQMIGAHSLSNTVAEEIDRQIEHAQYRLSELESLKLKLSPETLSMDVGEAHRLMDPIFNRRKF